MAGAQKFDAPRRSYFYFDPEDVRIIEDPSHVLYDERVNLPLDVDLMNSILDLGVRVPVLVRKGPDGVPEVVEGRQRVRCAREVNRIKREAGEEPIRIPVVPQDGKDAELFAVSIATNELRRADTPIVRAHKMASAMSRGYDLESVGRMFGCKASAVKAHLALGEAPKAVQRAVESGKLSVSAAVKAAKMDGDELETFLAEQGDKPATVEKVARKIREKRGETSAPSKKEIRAELGRMEQFKDDVEAVAMADAFRWVLTGERFGAMKSDP